MKAVVITQSGGPDVLQIEERPTPIPNPGEVLIKVAAAGLNRLDIFQRKGNYPAPQGVPQDILGLEVAGIIEALGDGVTRWQVGDRVCALLGGGGYAEYAAVAEGNCLPIPANLTFEEAASLPETYFTVWSNVFDRCGFKAGESVLVHGGSSGIGVATIQMVTAMGGEVYVTAGDDAKCAFCEKLGASRAINYKTESFKEVIHIATNGRGVDIILDSIGDDYTANNIASLADDGRLVHINTIHGKDVQIDLALIMHKRLTITGSKLRTRHTGFKTAIAQQLEQHIWPHLSSGKIRPVIYKTFPVNRAADAHRLMESSAHTGKIVLTF
ncbi:NAD(P)H-quinone oxidoreductase [Mucilaginibacter gynuensis]|uniref:NAD(P)H-quinone oxidoreductase n=1 Tax=Mucilaginibacter gynuensis TaxID=1302236 RepID=A0ABP8GQA2_9SPHI